jgi:hypothetical protein
MTVSVPVNVMIVQAAIAETMTVSVKTVKSVWTANASRATLMRVKNVWAAGAYRNATLTSVKCVMAAATA